MRRHARPKWERERVTHTNVKMWNAKRVRVHLYSLSLSLCIYIQIKWMCILYIIRTRHRQSKLRSIFLRASMQATKSECVFVSFTSFHFIGITFLGKEHVEFDGKWAWLFVSVLFLVRWTRDHCKIYFTPRSSKAIDRDTEGMWADRQESVWQLSPGVANVLCANYTI